MVGHFDIASLPFISNYRVLVIISVTNELMVMCG